MPSLNQIGALWRGLSRRQQITVLAGAVLVGGTLWVFVTLMGKDDYKPLYSGLAPGEAQAIARRLDSQKIPYELPSDGTSLRVPTSKLDAIRLDMASQGLPQSGRLGFELFDQPNWAGSDFAERVNYQRALEGELERTIQTIGGVEAVRVHLVLPRDSLFSEQESDSKASVVVKLRGGRLPDESIYAITHLVASAVDRLQPENVDVIDAEGRMPLLVSGKDGWTGGRRNGGPDSEFAAKLMDALTPVVGPGRAKASVTVDYDLSSTEMTNEAYDPNQSAVLTSQVSEEHTAGAGASGIPGTASNVPAARPAGGSGTTAASSDSQLQRSESKTFGVSKTVRHTVQPAGAIKRIAAAVLVDDAVEAVVENGQTVVKRRKWSPEEMKRIQDVAMAAIGFDQARGDRLAVENLSFEGLPLEKPVPPAGIQRFAPLVERWVGALRYAALLALFGLVYLLVLRPVKKQILTAFHQLPARIGTGENQSAALLGSPTGNATLTAGTGLELEAAFPPESLGMGADIQRALKLKQHLVDTVKKEPLGASHVIQSWVQQGEGSK